MTKFYLIILSFLPILFFSQQVWTLEDCIAYAEKNNLTNLQARINTAIQEKNLQIAEKEKLPSVSGSMNNSLNFGQNVILGSLQRSDNFSHSINVGGNFTLYNNGKIKKNIEKNRADLEALQSDELNIKNGVIIQIVQNYLQILLNREVLKINEESLSNAEFLYKKAQLTTSAGVTPKATESEAFAELERKREAKENAAIEVEKAKMNLALLLQIEDYHSFNVADTEANYEENILDKPLEELVSKAYADNPVVKSAMAKIKSAEIQTEILKTGFYPTVNLNAGLGTNYFNYFNTDIQRNEPFFRQYKNNFGQQVAVSVSVPIFNKSITRLQVEQSKLYRDLANNEYAKATMQVRQNIQKAYMDATAAKKSLISAIASEKATREAMEYAEKSYQAGRISIYDLNIARNNKANALGSLSQAKYNFIFAQKLLTFYAYQHF